MSFWLFFFWTVNPSHPAPNQISLFSICSELWLVFHPHIHCWAPPLSLIPPYRDLTKSYCQVIWPFTLSLEHGPSSQWPLLRQETAMTSTSSCATFPSPHTAHDSKGPWMLGARVSLGLNQYLAPQIWGCWTKQHGHEFRINAIPLSTKIITYMI